MKIRTNAHTHTIFCDGKNTVEEMALAAIRKGFVALGYSIHGYTPYELADLSYEREALYRSEVRRVREKYAGQIEIIMGAERDALYPRDFSQYEYLIDSVHYLLKNGEYLSVDYSRENMTDYVERHFAGDFYALTRFYYEECARMCSASRAAFIGHIDLITKFNEGGRLFDESDPRYLKPALEAVKCALERGKPLEMNTGAISRGYRTTPYPSATILKYIREHGGEIIINSDAHFAEAIDVGFDLCVEIARGCGFDHVLALRKNGFEEVSLID